MTDEQLIDLGRGGWRAYSRSKWFFGVHVRGVGYGNTPKEARASAYKDRQDRLTRLRAGLAETTRALLAAR